ncbi:hypothetical protein [Jannaschia sp. CCS1]|uniref:hypothetical protein n=1 Tax=Jannaschia sp. (strain CCS1) TaxID=290400 RepID=UPI000053CEB0|nr:hypothetical protein [Jannaschia sp. CCS1]ABD54412.1 conserved hypothetical cytosolic protein [Jannaschia sp. CCS1]
MSDVIAAHKHCIRHRPEVEASNSVGCFSCLAIYQPDLIVDWVADTPTETAICPHCGIDSVIGDASGHPVTPDFLGKMNAHWFRT